jgi:hypothetical protein
LDPRAPGHGAAVSDRSHQGWTGGIACITGHQDELDLVFSEPGVNSLPTEHDVSTLDRRAQKTSQTSCHSFRELVAERGRITRDVRVKRP